MSARVAVFASGGGTNLQALLDHFADRTAASIDLVISDRADAHALERARKAGSAAQHVPMRGREVDDVARELITLLEDSGIEWIALAGFMRLVPAELVHRFRDRMVNIHPALLPAFGGQGMYGRRVHEAVIAAGCTISGPTVHMVNERYDEGRILGQWPVPVLQDDTPESLGARVLAAEHRLYPLVLERLVSGAGAAEPPAWFTLSDAAPPDDAVRALLRP